MLLTILDNRTSSYASSVEFDVASFCFDWSQTLPKFEFESWKWMTMTTGDPVFWRWCVVRDSSSFETVASKDITSPVFKETTLEGCLTSPWTHIAVFILSWKRGENPSTAEVISETQKLKVVSFPSWQCWLGRLLAAWSEDRQRRRYFLWDNISHAELLSWLSFSFPLETETLPYRRAKLKPKMAVSSFTGMKQPWRRPSEDPTSSSCSWR